MALLQDNFQRPNGNLGTNWVILRQNQVDTPGTLGNIQLLNDAYAPSNVSAGDCGAVYTPSPTNLGNDQYAVATIAAIASDWATLSISAASISGTTVTYTYTLSAGNALTAGLDIGDSVHITGMADAGNNGWFVITALGSGTFDVTNASGVTRTAQTGTGIIGSDSGCGLVVRMSADGKNGYVFHAGRNSFSDTVDHRVYYRELWKVVNGVGTIINTGGNASQVGNSGNAYTSIPDSVNDVYALTVVGSTLTVYHNNTVLGAYTDTSIPSGGSTGIWSWSLAASNPGFTKTYTTSYPGNQGTQWTNWYGGDIQNADTQVLSDSFVYANGDLHTRNSNWVYQTGSFQISSNKCYASANPCWSHRSDDTSGSNQYSRVTAVVTVAAGVQNCGPGVRMISGSQWGTGYYAQFANNQLVLNVLNNTTATQLGSSASFPITGDVIETNVQGICIRVLKNSTPVITAFDTTYSAGQTGIYGAANATSNGFSAWSGGTSNVAPIFPVAVGPSTTGTVGIGQFFGTTFEAAFTNPESLDVVQVVNEGGKVVWNLSFNGTGASNPVSPTAGALFTYFGSSFAQAFNTNPDNLDVLQVVQPGGMAIFSVDYQGNAGSH